MLRRIAVVLLPAALWVAASSQAIPLDPAYLTMAGRTLPTVVMLTLTD